MVILDRYNSNLDDEKRELLIRNFMIFFNKGADINKKDAFGQTVLHFAACYNHHKIVNILLNSKKMNVEELDDRNKTAFQTAIEMQAFESIKEFLSYKQKRQAKLTSKKI